MAMAKAERKEMYKDIQVLMLKGENKAAFQKLTIMAADDVQLYCLTDYDQTMKRLNELEGAPESL